jgi:GNAT superfamily N-acetyltransferase
MVRRAVAADLEKMRFINPRLKANQIPSAIGNGECLVVEQDGAIAGYGCMDYRFFERGFVWLVYMAPPFRRRGFASRLLDAFEEQCTSARIFTSTNLSNLPMQALLASRQYVLSGVVQDLDERDSELFYSKRLR